MRIRGLVLAAAAAITGAALLAAPGDRARADIEVTLPPGTPDEWYRELPDRPPRYRFVQVEKAKPKPAEEEKGKKGTQVREKETMTTEVQARPELGSGTYVPMMFSGVLTVDLPFHVPWVARKGPLGPRTYPPAITDDLYWQAQSGYLRRLLHPPLVPESEVYWYLIMLGDASREVAIGAKAERFLEPLASAIETNVGKPPQDPPEVPAGKPGGGAEAKMILRLARDELMAGDPYSLDPAYAGRLLSLGDSGFGALLACAGSTHTLLRRNAVALLGFYQQPEALETLRKIVREEKDTVTRTRAFFHVIRHKDKEIVPDLLKALESADDKRFPPLAAFGLGLIGAPEAAPALARAIESNGDNWDLIVAATVAIGRIGPTPDSAAVISTLKKLEVSLRGPKPRFTEDRLVPRPAADIPDVPEVKNRMLLELATAALAKMGDKEGVARLRQLVAGGYDDPKNPVGHANASGPERSSQCDSLKWVCPSTHELLIETWGVLGAEGAAHLKQVIECPKSNEKARVGALKLEPIAKDKRYLGDVALGSDSAALRALAARLLSNLDDKAGLKVAENTLGRYASGKPMSKASPKGDVSVVTALEVLFRAKKLKPAVLKAPLARAIGEYIYERPQVTAEGMNAFRFSPPILETICWMLGATGDKEAVPLLKKVASDPKLPARAEAALALGRIPSDSALTALVELLEDEDAWVRYNAFLALRSATGEDHFADWLYGPRSERDAAVARYREFLKKKK